MFAAQDFRGRTAPRVSLHLSAASVVRYFVGFSVLASTFGLHAQASEGTLQHIRETGEIRIGHRESSIPFSYVLDDGKPVGFAIDLCARIVESVRADLKKPDVKVVYRTVNLSTQIPLLQNEGVDLVCGPATNTLERQKLVAFSNTIFVSAIRAIVKADSGIKRFDDLAGKTTALTSGSTSIALLTKYEQAHTFETKKVTSPDHTQSFQLLSSGRAQAFVMDDILLASMAASSPTPAEFRIIDDALRTEPYGLVLRKDDPEFKALIDRTLLALIKSGDFNRIYAKWFESPIPPRNVNLNFPMSKNLRFTIACQTWFSGVCYSKYE